jgi:8-amino-7-oxononanoate synthase
VTDAVGPFESSKPLSVHELTDRVLADRSANALLRRRRVVEPIDATHVRVDGRTLVNFSGNDYLGLARHPAIL